MIVFFSPYVVFRGGLGGRCGAFVPPFIPMYTMTTIAITATIPMA